MVRRRGRSRVAGRRARLVGGEGLRPFEVQHRRAPTQWRRFGHSQHQGRMRTCPAQLCPDWHRQGCHPLGWIRDRADFERQLCPLAETGGRLFCWVSRVEFCKGAMLFPVPGTHSGVPVHLLPFCHPSCESQSWTPLTPPLLNLRYNQGYGISLFSGWTDVPCIQADRRKVWTVQFLCNTNLARRDPLLYCPVGNKGKPMKLSARWS